MTETARLGFIVNEKAGDANGQSSRRAVVEERLRALGLDAGVWSPKEGQDLHDAAEEALQAGCEGLVAVGGDGTIAAVAEICYQNDVPMGVVPQGTFNYFARSLHIPQELDDAIRLIGDGALREVSLGEVNGSIFLNNASLGLYPKILQQREHVYRRWGRSRAAAYWSVVQTMMGAWRVLPLAVELDGRPEKLRTALAFVANSAYQLEQFNLDGADAIRDGQFVLFTARHETQMELVRAAADVALGRAHKGEDFAIHTARDIVIDPRRSRVLIARDGEKELMRAPLHIRRRDRPLRVFVPSESA